MRSDLLVTGMGVISAIGQGKSTFVNALLEGQQSFHVMHRNGRQRDSAFLGAEISAISWPDSVNRQTRRAASLSAQAALIVLQEAWEEARLSEVDPARIGLVVGGANVQQREITRVHDEYRDRIAFLRPSYALTFMDSDICGFCSAQFGILGAAYTVSGASASGQMAIIQAAQAVLAGHVDVCVAIGALMDLSYWECHAFRAIGAMGSDRYSSEPALACRPFDRDRDGFIFGESCGAVVIEAAGLRSSVRPYAALRGWGIAMDGNRNPDPSLEGEIRAIRMSLRSAGWLPSHIDYVNPHGTGSVVGDETELQALQQSELAHAHINATKSLIGHGLSSAGLVEVIATLLQMQAGRLHPTRNLENPIDANLRWVRGHPTDHQIKRALTLSMGFGGINTSMCWECH